MPSNWNVARLRPQMNLWCFSWTGAEDLLIYVTHWKVNIFVWVDEEKSQPLSNMGSMGSPPSYTYLSVLRMCLAQVAGRWGNTWHWACFPNVSVWDKRDESPERKSLTAQDFPWDFACAGLAGGSYVRNVLGHTGSEGSVSTWGCLGMALVWQCWKQDMGALLCLSLLFSVASERSGSCCPEWVDFHHIVSQLRPDKVLCALT